MQNAADSLNAAIAPHHATKSQGDAAPFVPLSGEDLGQLWQKTSDAIRRDIGDAAWRSWLAPLGALALSSEGVLTVTAPTRFMRDWVQTHYTQRIRAFWPASAAPLQSVEIVVMAQPAAPAAVLPSPLPASPPANQNASLAASSSLPLPGEKDKDEALSLSSLAAGLDPRCTFENFVVGAPNELAYAAARRVAENDQVSFTPLFLYGGVGLGKTHLMHAIAWAIRARNPERKVLYLSAERFMFQFVRALRARDTMAFKQLFRSVDVLMIDDVQFICGKESTQEEFFHTLNALMDENRQVVISADKSPADLEGMEERLRSRLGWGLVADIHPTTYELRLGILQSKAALLGCDIPHAVLEFLAHRITSNVRELEGALNRLSAHAGLIGRPVTMETAEDVLRDLLRANDRRLTIDDIQRRVAEHYNIRMADMHSPRRVRTIARPRQVAMYLAKQLTDRSLPEIGRKFGGRDHTTVIHGVRKIEALLESDKGLMEDVRLLKKSLGA